MASLHAVHRDAHRNPQLRCQRGAADPGGTSVSKNLGSGLIMAINYCAELGQRGKMKADRWMAADGC